jgi:hypothetical protein
MERLEEKGESVVVSILPDDKAAAAVELFGYFKNSFGNKTRYGNHASIGYQCSVLLIHRLIRSFASIASTTERGTKLISPCSSTVLKGSSAVGKRSSF